MSETDGGASSDEDGAAEQYQLSDTDGGESSDEEDVAKHNIAPTVGTTDASEVVGCKGDADLASAVGTTDASELAGTGRRRPRFCCRYDRRFRGGRDSGRRRYKHGY